VHPRGELALLLLQKKSNFFFEKHRKTSKNIEKQTKQTNPPQPLAADAVVHRVVRELGADGRLALCREVDRARLVGLLQRPGGKKDRKPSQHTNNISININHFSSNNGVQQREVWRHDVLHRGIAVGGGDQGRLFAEVC
jgi:hypothetical protein